MSALIATSLIPSTDRSVSLEELDLGRPTQRGPLGQMAIYRSQIALGKRPVVSTRDDVNERRAQDILRPSAAAYIYGAAGTERTAARNRSAFDRWQCVPTQGIDVSQRSAAVKLSFPNGASMALESPLMIAPIGALNLANQKKLSVRLLSGHPFQKVDELDVARAAAKQGVPMIVSSQSCHSMEAIRASMLEVSPQSQWMYQLYFGRYRPLALSMVRRAEAAGATAIMITLDTKNIGWRPRDLDLGSNPMALGLAKAEYDTDPVFAELLTDHLPALLEAASQGKSQLHRRLMTALRQAKNFTGTGADRLRLKGTAAVELFMRAFQNPALDWDDIAWIKQQTKLPVIVKGVLSEGDAREAVARGLDGVVVSNHGGRQCDLEIASLDALPRVVEAIDRKMPVFFDSGVRSGTEAFVALGLGADAVLIGRPVVSGLAIAGEEGVEQVLRNMLDELDLAMAHNGCKSVSEIPARVERCAS